MRGPRDTAEPAELVVEELEVREGQPAVGSAQEPLPFLSELAFDAATVARAARVLGQRQQLQHQGKALLIVDNDRRQTAKVEEQALVISFSSPLEPALHAAKLRYISRIPKNTEEYERHPDYPKQMKDVVWEVLRGGILALVEKPQQKAMMQDMKDWLQLQQVTKEGEEEKAGEKAREERVRHSPPGY